MSGRYAGGKSDHVGISYFSHIPLKESSVAHCRYHDALMTSMSAAIVAADIGGPNAETWQPPPEEDSYDEASSGIGEEDEGEYDDSSDDDYEDDDSSDDQEGLVPTLASISDEL